MNKNTSDIEQNLDQEKIAYYNNQILIIMKKSTSFFWGAIFLFSFGFLSIFNLNKKTDTSDDYNEINGLVSKISFGPRTKNPTFYINSKDKKNQESVFIDLTTNSLKIPANELIGKYIKFKTYDNGIVFSCYLNEAPICNPACNSPSKCRDTLSKRDRSLLTGILFITWPSGLISLFIYFLKSRKEELNVQY